MQSFFSSAFTSGIRLNICNAICNEKVFQSKLKSEWVVLTICVRVSGFDFGQWTESVSCLGAPNDTSLVQIHGSSSVTIVEL